MLNTIPDMNLHRFARDYLDDGIDPVAPLVRIGEGGMVTEGVILLKKDKYITNLNPKKARIFFLLLGEFFQGDLSIQLNNEHALFSFLGNQRDIKVNVDEGGKIQVKLDVQFQGYLLEYHGPKDLSKRKDVQELEKQIVKYLDHESKSILKIIQERKMDNLGFGQYIRNHLSYKEWKKLKWPDNISDIDIDPHFKVEIQDTGIIQ